MKRLLLAGAVFAAATMTGSPAEAKHVGAIWPCQYFIPHTGDDLFYWAWASESNPDIDKAHCAADHPGGGQHFYCVVEWHTNPIQWTWGPGWC